MVGLTRVRDAIDAFRGRIEHGDECECHACKRETLRYDAEYKAESEAIDRKAADRKAARKAVRKLAERHGPSIARAMDAAETWTAGKRETVGSRLDCIAVRLPYGGDRLVVTVIRDGSHDD